MGFSKTMLTGRVIAIQSYIQGQGKHQIKNLPLHLNRVRKKNPKISGKEAIKKNKKKKKIRAEIGTNEMKECIVNFNTTQSSSSQKINKIDQSLARLINMEKEKY